jgi:hypothetical protein
MMAINQLGPPLFLRRPCRYLCLELEQRRVEIGPKIVRVFQADADAQDRALVAPGLDSAVTLDRHRRDQAARAAPGGADGEDLQRRQCGVEIGLGARLQHDAEHARRALDVARPELVAGAGGKAGMLPMPILLPGRSSQ